MDLYIAPLSSSFAAHVACIEAGVPHALRRVDRRTKRIDDGADYRGIAPQGNVPAIGLPDGSVLTEIAAVLQYIADLAPEKELAPPRASQERYRLAEWLHFVGTELHKGHLWMIFSSRTPDVVKDWARSSAAPALAHAAARLEDREHLVGERFTVADAYLYWALLAAPHGGIPLDAWPPLGAYVARLRQRDSIQRAFAIEAPLYAREARAVAAAATPRRDAPVT